MDPDGWWMGWLMVHYWVRLALPHDVFLPFSFTIGFLQSIEAGKGSGPTTSMHRSWPGAWMLTWRAWIVRIFKDSNDANKNESHDNYKQIRSDVIWQVVQNDTNYLNNKSNANKILMIRTIIRKTFEFTTFEEFFKRSLNVLYMANLTDVNPP